MASGGSSGGPTREYEMEFDAILLVMEDPQLSYRSRQGDGLILVEDEEYARRRRIDNRTGRRTRRRSGAGPPVPGSGPSSNLDEMVQDDDDDDDDDGIPVFTGPIFRAVSRSALATSAQPTFQSTRIQAASPGRGRGRGQIEPSQVRTPNPTRIDLVYARNGRQENWSYRQLTVRQWLTLRRQTEFHARFRTKQAQRGPINSLNELYERFFVDWPDQSRRALDFATQVSTTNLELNKLIEGFKCFVCNLVAFDGLHLCRRGHMVCTVCLKNMAESGIPLRCGNCHEPGPPVPAVDLNGIIEHTSFFCEYKPLGCDKVIKGLEYLEHVRKECPSRFWKCYLCSTPLSSKTFLEHMEKENGVIKFKIEKLPGNVTIPIVINSDEYETRGGSFVISLFKVGSSKNFILFQVFMTRWKCAWFLGYTGEAAASSLFTSDFTLDATYKSSSGVEQWRTITSSWWSVPVVSCFDDFGSVIFQVLQSVPKRSLPTHNFQESQRSGEMFHEACLQIKVRDHTPSGITRKRMLPKERIDKEPPTYGFSSPD